MAFVPAKKQALLVPSGGVLHLHIIVTDRCKDGDHLLVNVSSIDPAFQHDDACEMQGGEHSALPDPSYVIYRYAARYGHDDLIKRVASNIYKLQPPVSDALFAKICDGIAKSRMMPPALKTYYNIVEGKLVVVTKRLTKASPGTMKATFYKPHSVKDGEETN